MKSGQILPIAIITTILILANGVWLTIQINRNSGSSGAGDSVQAEQLRDFAATLKANQLYRQAADAYDRYLSLANISQSDKARIDFNTAVMLLDQVGDAEGALAHLIRVTDLYKDAPVDIVKEARRLSANCLEQLGRSGAAQRQLVSASQLKQPDNPDSALNVEEAEILAELDGKVCLTRSEFEDLWNELPGYIKQQQFSGEDGKQQFLSEVTSRRVIAESARRKGLDRDPAVRQRLNSISNQVLQAAYLQSEVVDKINLSDDDINLFYRANLNHYVKPAEAELAHILVNSETVALAIASELAQGATFEQLAAQHSLDTNSRDQAGRIGVVRLLPAPLEEESEYSPYAAPLPGLGVLPELVQSVFESPSPERVTGPVASRMGYHLVKVTQYQPQQQLSLEEARQQVERDLRIHKQTQAQKELALELGRVHKLRVYPERLKG